MSKGFSIIELMIVVVLLGVLGSIAAPSYQRYALKSKYLNAVSFKPPVISIITDRSKAVALQSNIDIPLLLYYTCLLLCTIVTSCAVLCSVNGDYPRLKLGNLRLLHYTLFF